MGGGLVGKLIAPFYWVRARAAWERGETPAALAYLERIERYMKLPPSAAAFKAMLLIDLRRYFEADALLDQIIEQLGDSRTDDARYVEIVCRLWRAESFHDLPDANALWAEALALDCAPRLRRYLLLRPPPELRLRRIVDGPEK